MSPDKQKPLYLTKDNKFSIKRHPDYQSLAPIPEPPPKHKHGKTPYQLAWEYLKQLTAHRDGQGQYLVDNNNGGTDITEVRNGVTFISSVGEDGDPAQVELHLVPKPNFDDLTPVAKKIYFMLLHKK